MTIETRVRYRFYLIGLSLFLVAFTGLLCYRVCLTLEYDTRVKGVLTNLTKESGKVLSTVEFEFRDRKINAVIDAEDEDELLLLGGTIYLYYSEARDEVVTSDKVGLSGDNLLIGACWLLMTTWLVIMIRRPGMIVKYFDNDVPFGVL